MTNHKKQNMIATCYRKQEESDKKDNSALKMHNIK